MCVLRTLHQAGQTTADRRKKLLSVKSLHLTLPLLSEPSSQLSVAQYWIGSRQASPASFGRKVWWMMFSAQLNNKPCSGLLSQKWFYQMKGFVIVRKYLPTLKIHTNFDHLNSIQFDYYIHPLFRVIFNFDKCFDFFPFFYFLAVGLQRTIKKPWKW